VHCSAVSAILHVCSVENGKVQSAEAAKKYAQRFAEVYEEIATRFVRKKTLFKLDHSAGLLHLTEFV
jgi:hypothetical protein